MENILPRVAPLSRAPFFLYATAPTYTSTYLPTCYCVFIIHSTTLLIPAKSAWLSLYLLSYIFISLYLHSPLPFPKTFRQLNKKLYTFTISGSFISSNFTVSKTIQLCCCTPEADKCRARRVLSAVHGSRLWRITLDQSDCWRVVVRHKPNQLVFVREVCGNTNSTAQAAAQLRVWSRSQATLWTLAKQKVPTPKRRFLIF